MIWKKVNIFPHSHPHPIFPPIVLTNHQSSNDVICSFSLSIFVEWHFHNYFPLWIQYNSTQSNLFPLFFLLFFFCLIFFSHQSFPFNPLKKKTKNEKKKWKFTKKRKFYRIFMNFLKCHSKSVCHPFQLLPSWSLRKTDR